MKVGDLVRIINGLSEEQHQVGVVMAVGTYCKNPMVESDDGRRADVLMAGDNSRPRRFECYSLEVINENR